MSTATTNSATVEQGESDGVRVVRVSGSLSQRGVADVSPAFAAAVRGEGDVPVPARDAVETARVLEAARVCASGGGTIHLR